MSGAGVAAEVTWQDLPICVAARIVRTALHDSGGGLVPWLRYSTVCRRVYASLICSVARASPLPAVLLCCTIDWSACVVTSHTTELCNQCVMLIRLRQLSSDSTQLCVP